MDKYLTIAYYGVRQEWHSPASSVGRIGFYAIITFIFSCLWAAIGGEGGLLLEKETILWYLIITEGILLALPQIHVSFEEDYRYGDVHTHMLRPISYLGMRVSYFIGILLFRLLTNAVAGGVLGFLFAGYPHHGIEALFGAVLMGVSAGVLLLLFQAIVGLSAFWLHDATPLYWVWQKGNFVLGGLMVPLVLYPEWLQWIAFGTPFYATLYNSGRLALEGVEVLRFTLPLIAAWYMVAIVLLRIAGRRVEMHLLKGEL